MMDAKKKVIVKLMEKTAKALEKNNMKCVIADTKDDVLPIVKSMLKDGQTVAGGGSMTLVETGVTDYLRNGGFKLFEVNPAVMTPDELKKCYRDTLLVDTYFCSANAITENGELYNVDGRSNRVAALCFGPDKVIVVAGYNKIVSDIDAACLRVKNIAAPANCVRLGCDTFCAANGNCTSGNSELGNGCGSAGRICCNYLVSAYQRESDRITVILVGEELGF